MDYKDIVAISGLGGLFKSENQRGDGMIVTSLDDGNTKFVPSRNHLFTPLETITVYTEEDSVDLYEIFQKMNKDESPVPNASKASADDLKKYFETIQPDYDKEQVYISDIKKIVKWFDILKDKIDFTKDLEEKEEEGKKKGKDEEE